MTRDGGLPFNFNIKGLFYYNFVTLPRKLVQKSPISCLSKNNILFGKKSV